MQITSITSSIFIFVSVLLQSYGQNTDGRCSNGPYLIVKVERQVGIGAMMNSFKPSLVIAKYLNLTVIPTWNYFHWNETPDHPTDFMRTIGFGVDMDCDENDTIPQNIEQSGLKKILINLEKEKMTLTKQDIHTLYQDNAKITNEIDPNGLIHVLLSTLQENKDNSKKLLIFVDTKINLYPFHEEAYVNTREIFATTFRHRYYDIDLKRSDVTLGRSIHSMENDLVIAWHFRYGDVKTGSKFITPYNALPYQDGVNIIQKLLYDEHSVLFNLTGSFIKVKFVVWGWAEDFKDIPELFDKRAEIITSDDPAGDYLHFEVLATSDILVGGVSSFTR
jgi:hypothetical protein